MNPLLLGGAVGALAMYFLDPQSGRRRRARTRDQVVHAARKANEAGKVTARDTAHRAAGLVAGTRRLFQREDVGDEALVARVRSSLGRVVSHPHAIEVGASDGHVTLDGPILAHEVRGLLRTVRSVAGVRGVSDRLEVHQDSNGVPALQGGVPRSGERFELMQANWSPAARLAAGALGLSMMGAGARAKGRTGALLSVAGGALLARCVTNMDFRHMLGFGEASRGITVQKTIHVDAPAAKVYSFWTDYQNFPRFMANVRNIRQLPDNRSSWTVAGPGGLPVQWTAEVTRTVAERLIEWRCTESSDVRHEGAVRFEPNGEGTRVNVQAELRPPGGRLRAHGGEDVRRRSQERDGHRPAADEDDDRDRASAARRGGAPAAEGKLRRSFLLAAQRRSSFLTRSASSAR